MKKKLLTGMLCLCIAVSLFAGGRAEKADSTDISHEKVTEETKEITVFNAASTTDLINDMGELFQQKFGVTVKTNPASSGTLAKQIEEGAPVDVYISASKKWMDYVEDLGVVEERSPFAKNRLVLIAPEDSLLEPFSISKETDFTSLFEGRLSMGDPAHVPAGKYAEEVLINYGWHEALENRIQPAADVRAALLVVEMGEAELGIVYETDAIKSGKVKVLSRFPEDSHTPIVYYSAVLEESNPEGRMFFEFLSNDDDAAEIYKKYGFSTGN